MNQVVSILERNMNTHDVYLVSGLGSTLRLVMWQVCDQLPLRTLGFNTQEDLAGQAQLTHSCSSQLERTVIPEDGGQESLLQSLLVYFFFLLHFCFFVINFEYVLSHVSSSRESLNQWVVTGLLSFSLVPIALCINLKEIFYCTIQTYLFKQAT